MADDPFNAIDEELRKDAGCTTELDYIGQTSWLLFLKYLDSMESRRKLAAEIQGKSYSFILVEEFRWSSWAAPKKDGEIDYNIAMTGDDLLDFVNDDLFPYLAGFHQRATSPDTIEYKIGEIFGELSNLAQQGYTLRNVIDIIDEFEFGTNEEKYEMSQLYEDKIGRMGNAGRNGGEYYTPRPLIRAMVTITDPKIGETIYDGAVGSAGFLCEAYDYLKSKPNLSTNDLSTLQNDTFYGKEKKGLAYVIGIMNMILHGIDAPNIIHTNTLGQNVMDIQEKDRHDIVLANPPFGGKERKEIQQNFPIRTGETAMLFVQHFMKKLRTGGRAAIVLMGSLLSDLEPSFVQIRKELLSNFNLHTILLCPMNTFLGAKGVRTAVLFFEKGSATREIWYYKLNPSRNFGKKNPLVSKDLAEFLEFQKNKTISNNSWIFNIDEIDSNTYDLLMDRSSGASSEVESPTTLYSKLNEFDIEVQEIMKQLRGGI